MTGAPATRVEGHWDQDRVDKRGTLQYQEEIKLPRAPAGFVLPPGATMNRNGSALYEGAMVLFLAQDFGVHLSLGQQVLGLQLAVVTTIGTAIALESDDMIEWFRDLSPIQQALAGTLGTWFLTALGAAVVLLFREINRTLLDTMLGFAAGVMIAASFWSLLAPAIEMAEADKMPGWIPAVIGFLLGGAFLWLIDSLLPHLHPGFPTEEAEGIKTSWQRSVLLVLAITLHNIPEGLAVGVAFGAVGAGLPAATLGGAIALAIGIGIQNFPEGAAVSVPLRREGMSRLKSFWYGQLSGVVEPIAGVVGALAVVLMRPILPYALSFAAGAMIYVVVEELIPESQLNKKTHEATWGALFGFTVMMMLDVALG